MKKDPLNHQLIDEFPVLKQTYATIKGGAFDLDTPAANFYEGIFVPYCLSCIEKSNGSEVNHCFRFIEQLLNSEEEESQNLALSTILVSLYESGADLEHLPLGQKSHEYYLTWLKE